jgi:hypothetical protein
MDVCVRLFCVCVVLCVGSCPATSWSPVQGFLPAVYWLTKWKGDQGPQGLWSHRWIDRGCALHGWNPHFHFLEIEYSNKLSNVDTLQLAVEERPTNMFPFNKLLQIKVIAFFSDFVLNWKLTIILFTGSVLRENSYVFQVMWPWSCATCREKCRRASPHTEKSDKPAQWTPCRTSSHTIFSFLLLPHSLSGLHIPLSSTFPNTSIYAFPLYRETKFHTYTKQQIKCMVYVF